MAAIPVAVPGRLHAGEGVSPKGPHARARRMSMQKPAVTSVVLFPHRPLCQFDMPVMRVIAGRICLPMISMRGETVIYRLVEAMKQASHASGFCDDKP